MENETIWHVEEKKNGEGKYLVCEVGEERRRKGGKYLVRGGEKDQKGKGGNVMEKKKQLYRRTIEGSMRGP